MLGPIIRALVGVSFEHHGIILDVVNKLGGRDVSAVRSRIALALRNEPFPPPASPDTIIRVDHAVRPIYPIWIRPEWINSSEFIALEGTGPTEYNLGTVQLWLHEEQERGMMGGHALRVHLKSNDMLGGCLGLAIQQKGIKIFRQFFHYKVVFLWRSVVWLPGGKASVPFLMEDGDKVVLRWRWLDRSWLACEPAARFAS
jgi:hypothetical protein